MKIPMVLTSHDQPGNTGCKTGLWLENFAAPYFVFMDAGVDLTLASPKGSQPPIDPKSDLPICAASHERGCVSSRALQFEEAIPFDSSA